MASGSPDKKKAKRSSKKRRLMDSDHKLERLNSLPWNSSLPEGNDGSDDPFSLFIGSNELEGGLLALEEINESEYGLEFPKIELGNVKKRVIDKRKRNKRKNSERNDDTMFDGETVGEPDGKNDGVKVEDGKGQGKLGKTKKNVKKMKIEDQKNDREDEAVEKTAASDGKNSFEEDSVDEDEYSSWNELRLHPLLMKAIYKLKFREPTPIQKACIPVAAHQGKDVIGAAETGSGKTLAFGLPILQRLLEEQEKVERLLEEKGEANERIAPRSFIRALIVTPTRELALQVTDHLKEVAKGTIFRVVPIVGGMSTEKQERLLKASLKLLLELLGDSGSLCPGERFILWRCREEEKDAYLYYILSIHGQGRTIAFCTSISALHRISSLLRILGVNVWTLHSEMQQRARLKAVDSFRANEHSILVGTDVAARGLDIPGVRTVIHYQLPLSAEVYVHRCGRTARAFTDGCSIVLISPSDASKFAALCNSFSKESFQRFPVEVSYMPEVMKRSSLAQRIDKIARKDSQEKAEKSWLERNAESVELVLEDNDSEDERMKKYRQKKATSNQLKKLQQELNTLLSRPLQPKTFPKRFLAGAGVSPLLQHQFEELARQKTCGPSNIVQNKRQMVVIGQDCVEPLQALRSASKEASLDLKEIAEKHKSMDNLRKKRKEMKKRMHEQRRKQRRKLKQGS